MNNHVVIVGAGQGGFQVASSLRDKGFEGLITLIGNEGTLPYERPPLSKTYITGDRTREGIQLRPESFFTSRQIDLIINDEVEKLERRTHSLVLRSGSRLIYDKLVLATGARNHKLPFDHTAEGIHYLRTAAEADSIRSHLTDANDVIIVGAGFIGLELAACLTKLRKKVVLLDRMPRVMSRALSTITSDYFADLHTAWGATLVLCADITDIVTNNGVISGVKLADGSVFPADLVLVGIGVVANAELAMNDGLPVRNGIVVDRELRTPDPDIYAIGDCAEFPSSFDGTSIRLESIQNTVDQARYVAGHILGYAGPYTSVPWFWSDQADTKLQIAGLVSPCDHAVLRGNVADGKFSVFCFMRDRLVGVESVNMPADHMIARKLIATGARLTARQAADPDFDLRPSTRMD